MKKYKEPIICIVLAVAAVALAMTLGGVSGAVSASAEPYRTGNTDAGKIAITCNVAWGQEFLPEMLQILEEKDVKITFNILGEWAEGYPDDLRSIAEAGHELGNHGYYHVNHSEIDDARIVREIEDTNARIKSITGITPTIFAPPSGDYNERSAQTAADTGMKVILWSIDTIDWRREGRQIILDRVFKDPKAGDIILMHPTEYTVQALAEMIDGLRQRGLEPCTVSEILS